MVSTGSILNSRTQTTYKPGGTSGGVKPNTLTQTRITLADRNRGSGRASYTSMSNKINGRAVLINVGGGECTHGAPKTSFLGKMARALSDPNVQKAAMLGFSAMQKVLNSHTDSVKKEQHTGNESLASTLDSLGFTDIDLTNIDYEQTAKDFTSKMDKAKNSQDLYQALQGAKAYKQQISVRMSNMDIGKMDGELKTLKGEAEGSVSKAKDGVDKANSDVKTQEGIVSKDKQGLDSARMRYDNTRAILAKTSEKFKDQSEDVDSKTKLYDRACKKFDEATTAYSDAQAVTRECTKAYNTAKLNTEQAQKDYDALIGQQGSADSAALQVQIAAAKTRLEGAKQAENSAKLAEDAAKEKEQLAETAKDAAANTMNSTKADMTQARNTLSGIAKELSGQNADSASAYKNLQEGQSNLDIAENTLESSKKALTAKQEIVVKEQEKLDELTAKKEELEVRVHDYEEMKKASEKLNDLSKYETKLADMMKKEQTTREELEAKIAQHDETTADSATSAKDRAKTQKKATKESKKLDKLNAGDATDDIARDQALNTQNEVDMMSQTKTHKADPLQKMTDMVQKAKNEQALKNLKLGIPAEINGKHVMRMPGIDADTFVVNGKNYSFEELQKAVQEGKI